jgi:hypothetical protein
MIGIVGAAGAGGQAPTGAGGAGGATVIAVPCAGPADDRLVVAEQRILLLTSTEIVNTIRALIDATEADELVTSGRVNVTASVDTTFPPADGEQLKSIPDRSSLQPLEAVAEHVADYVLQSFAALTGCAPATDACATAYLDKLAARAYRRQLTPGEQTRFSALYTNLRAAQIVNGYEVTFTVQEATSYAVRALLMSPQMLWRWELGDPASASASPPGIYLTDDELATHLAFFFTNEPPDDALRAAASAGTLRANLATHVNTLLAKDSARAWLRSMMEVYFWLNQLPAELAVIDAAKFPLVNKQLLADMGTEARKFLDNVLWNGSLTDLLLSRTAFLNNNLATNIYSVPVPPGATQTTFVQTTLPADKRAGLLTNAGVLTTRARAEGPSVVARGQLVSRLLLCMTIPVPTDSSGAMQPPPPGQTAQEQAASRAMVPLCNACHAQIDPFGLALENYDGLGRYRTVDDMGRPIDAHATLPAFAGGGTVANAVELAQALAARPEFTNCMATAMLQYAMVTYNASPIEVPNPPAQAGCAVADVVQRYQSRGGKTFTDLVRATTAAPGFVLRRAAQ